MPRNLLHALEQYILFSLSHEKISAPFPLGKHCLYLPEVFAIQTILNKNQCHWTKVIEIHDIGRILSPQNQSAMCCFRNTGLNKKLGITFPRFGKEIFLRKPIEV